jgi:hypothetical protein
VVALVIAIVAAGFWPGVPMYDTVAQYRQVLGAEVDDWHPPVMVRLWQLLHHTGSGTGPMLALQVALYALGFALIVTVLVRTGRWRAGLAAAVLAVSPLSLGWQMVVLKDAQMLGALVCAMGIVAHFRLSGRPVLAWAIAIIVILMTYATLVRANALFATVPLAVLLLPKPRATLSRAALIVTGIGLVLAAAPLINHRLLGAEPSNVAKTQALFDLAAIAVATPSPGPFTPAERAEIINRHCVKAFFWDPLGDPGACGPATDRLMAAPAEPLYWQLAAEVAAHPLAYAAHRFQHWNSTERWLVPPGRLDAGPPDEAEPNDLGLETPLNALVGAWQSAAAAEAGTPLGWPIVWTLVAVMLLPLAWRRRMEPNAGLALALLTSAITLDASFLVISIASDMRYHLWSMTASALALILLSADIRLRSRPALAAGGLLALVIAAGLWTRATLPEAPSTYQAMIHAASG